MADMDEAPKFNEDGMVVDESESDSEPEAEEELESDQDDGGEEEAVVEIPESQKRAYLPGKPRETPEELEFDESAYVMYHQANAGTPCLSFDILKDELGDGRETFPLSCYIVAGTQEELNYPSQLLIMKMTNMNKMPTDEESESSSDSDSDSETESTSKKNQPCLDTTSIKHNGCVNRVRAFIHGNKKLAATWSENGIVYIWDLQSPLEAVEDSATRIQFNKAEHEYSPMRKFRGHPMEGFALDWSPTVPGRLLSGDCKKNIHLWVPQETGWKIDQRPFVGHISSVEDLQWSPVEENVFASCSVDKSIRIWDARAVPNKANMLTATRTHAQDVNVISWNKFEPFILSGSDDAIIKVWDLRKFQTGKPVASFKHHHGPITSIEWNPNDSSVFAAAGQDNQITLWDLSVERENDDPDAVKNEPDVPPQLLFIHQGQTEIKEIHWHPQLPGTIISTAATGFNVFRTISV